MNGVAIPDRSTGRRALVGRAGLIGDLVAVAAAALEGSGQVVALHGALGVGLTTVLDEVAAVAARRGVEVVTVRARSTEQALRRTVLRDLCASIGVPELSRTLTLCTDADLPAEFTEALLVRSVPTLIVIDDLDHADEASLEVIRFLGHRVGRGSVSLVVSCRDTATVTGLPLVDVRGLDAAAITTLLQERPDCSGISPAVAASIHRASQGNPLTAVAIATSLGEAQRRGDEPLPPFPALGIDVIAAVSASVNALPAATRHALVLAAAEPSGDLRVLSRAAPHLGVSLDSLAAAEECGIVVIDDGAVRFDLPLRRLAVYHSVAAPSRRAAHRALAAALDAPADAKRRALHLALGATEPDERIAADLELAALAAERRGDPAVARQWWHHAARLSPVRADADARRRRARLAADTASGPFAALTDAERRVATVVGAGASNKAAAVSLGVSAKTVDSHLQSIFRKLGLRSRSELAMVVARHETGTSQEVDR